MTYFEAFESVKKKLKNAKTDSLKEDFAIQVNLTDEDCNGAFYIELKDGTLNVEPYDYVDRNAMVSSSYADLVNSIDKKGIAEGVAIEGDKEVVEALFKSIKKAVAKKPATKKTTTAKKPTAKKTTAQKSETKATVKSAETKATVKTTETKATAKSAETKATAKKAK